MKICEYIRCNKQVLGRPNKKFCCRNCKIYNRIMIKNKMKKDIKLINKIIKNISTQK